MYLLFTCTDRAPVAWGVLVLTLIIAVHPAQQARAASFEKLLMPGPLSAAHAEFENDCGSCHDPLGEKSQAQLCSTCHENVGDDLATATGFHGKHSRVQTEQCQSCHREHQGLDAATLAFDLTGFDHTLTDFPLDGGHVGVECAGCHEPDQVHHAAPTACGDCHNKDDVHKGALGGECSTCHMTTTWEKTSFNHASSSFPLLGAHQFVACDSCHKDQLFAGTPDQCVACHEQQDVHKGAFGQACGTCHTQSAWQNTEFDHGTTGFFLRGAHSDLTCSACHNKAQGGAAAGTSCASCHAQDDPHKGQRGQDCGSCHSEKTWRATFDHASKTGFALLGAHADLQCSTCHEGGLEQPIPSTCHECHTPEPHAGQLGLACDNCHNTSSFTAGLRFDHHLSEFPLLGKHAALACDDCHKDLRFHDAGQACESCHASDTPHGDRMSMDCASCHNPVDWQVTRFDHAQQANFALTGQHEGLACDACHNHPLMLRAQEEQQCSQCHQQDDPHEGNFGRSCEQCHSTNSFKAVKGFGP